MKVKPKLVIIKYKIDRPFLHKREDMLKEWTERFSSPWFRCTTIDKHFFYIKVSDMNLMYSNYWTEIANIIMGKRDGSLREYVFKIA